MSFQLDCGPHWCPCGQRWVAGTPMAHDDVRLFPTPCEVMSCWEHGTGSAGRISTLAPRTNQGFPPRKWVYRHHAASSNCQPSMCAAQGLQPLFCSPGSLPGDKTGPFPPCSAGLSLMPLEEGLGCWLGQSSCRLMPTDRQDPRS